MQRTFEEALNECLRQIPRGRVATCGVVARALGDVRAARAVSSWIAEHPDFPPGHRVVRADGRPVVPEAKRTLVREGLRFSRGLVHASHFVESLEAVDFLGILRNEQLELGRRVVEEDPRRQIELVAGVDLAYDGGEAYAVAASVTLPDLDLVEIAAVRRPVDFPYIPTYLAYREAPGIEEAVCRLQNRPDVLLIDGHGRLHPTLFGVACAVGVHLDLSTIDPSTPVITINAGFCGTVSPLFYSVLYRYDVQKDRPL